ncbi:MAG TPA: arginine decarboxylase, pyruvoyl-dependent [Nitrososphaerales archaeon]|nr:arginine decarboxylase, pyruvoyl-dependent [Nitrososphaerales archaeon]
MAMMGQVPRFFFLTKGVGRHKEQLASFEVALRDAGISSFNLVTVSSIIPPGCRQITKEQGAEMLRAGEIVFLVLARNSTNEPHRLLASSIGLAIPKDETVHGYLSEWHDFGMTEEEAGEYSEDLAAQMLASTLGLDFDINTSWDEREQVFKSSGKIIRTANITQSAVAIKGQWTTVIAGAVFIL